MEFKGKPTGTFRDDARWQGDMMAVEFTLDVRDDERDHAIRCLVARKALEDAAQIHRSGPLEGAEALKLFERFKKKIESVVVRKLKLGHFEDGSIIIRGVDLTG